MYCWVICFKVSLKIVYNHSIVCGICKYRRHFEFCNMTITLCLSDVSSYFQPVFSTLKFYYHTHDWSFRKHARFAMNVCLSDFYIGNDLKNKYSNHWNRADNWLKNCLPSLTIFWHHSPPCKYKNRQASNTFALP